jgi:CBS domain-containing protein
MPMTVSDLMTKEVIRLPVSATVSDAAQCLRDADIGDVIVEWKGILFGILTDRDIVVRVIATGQDPSETRVEHACSQDLVTAMPDDDIERVIDAMRIHSLRRMPVVDRRGRVVGIVSLGDLARVRDADSVLGRISAAPPNQ